MPGAGSARSLPALRRAAKFARGVPTVFTRRCNMRRMRGRAGVVQWVLLSLGVLSVLVLPYGCDRDGGGGSGGRGSRNSSGEILIGHYASMTGDPATFGVSADEGIRLAMNEINAAGGV